MFKRAWKGTIRRPDNPGCGRREMGDVGEINGRHIEEVETSQTQHSRAEKTPAGLENRLTLLVNKIIESDYSSMEDLVVSSGNYSIDEIHAFLNEIIVRWRAKELTPAATYALLKFAHLYLEQPKVQITFKNRPPIPICYFSPHLPTGASLVHSYLKTLSFAVALFSLGETDHHLRESIEKNKPPAIIFSVSQFLHIHSLRQLVPYLHDSNLKIFVGGIPFVYDDSLKQAFPGCVFPHDLPELTLLLENSLKEERR
jgi:hypothetical protein